MKSLFIPAIWILLILIAYPATCQNDTTIYFGANGKLNPSGEIQSKREIKFKKSAKIESTVSVLTDVGWNKSFTERIEIDREGIYHIRQIGEGKGVTFDRRFDPQSDGTFRFTEYREGEKLRTGITLSKMPLVLHGEVTEYYRDGKIRSVSQFRNNELISNQNWLENGEKYIDNIYYSVDEVPLLSGGTGRLHQHVLEAFRNSGIDFTAISGNILMGFVVTEDGKMEGIRVVKGLTPQLNGVAVSALKTIMTSWKPAQLNGKTVRYFHLFPINFISREVLFQSLEFDGSMLHYDRN